MPGLGSGAWPFDPPSVDPRGILGPLVRVADREWDLGILRSTAILAGLLVALAAAASWRFRTWPRWAAIGLAGVVCAMLLVPAVLLQVGLRDATAPWYFTNDSTYQIEIAGDLVLDGDSPYGHDYGDSGLENFYPAADDEEAAFDRAARHHFAYFPGTALTAAAWRLLPRPWDDYRLFVAARDLRAAACGPALPRASGRATRGRLRPCREPAHRPGSLVRDRRCPGAAGARPLVRPGRRGDTRSGPAPASERPSRSSSSRSSPSRSSRSCCSSRECRAGRCTRPERRSPESSSRRCFRS